MVKRITLFLVLVVIVSYKGYSCLSKPAIDIYDILELNPQNLNHLPNNEFSEQVARAIYETINEGDLWQYPLQSERPFYGSKDGVWFETEGVYNGRRCSSLLLGPGECKRILRGEKTLSYYMDKLLISPCTLDGSNVLHYVTLMILRLKDEEEFNQLGVLWIEKNSQEPFLVRIQLPNSLNYMLVPVNFGFVIGHHEKNLSGQFLRSYKSPKNYVAGDIYFISNCKEYQFLFGLLNDSRFGDLRTTKTPVNGFAFGENVFCINNNEGEENILWAGFSGTLEFPCFHSVLLNYLYEEYLKMVSTFNDELSGKQFTSLLADWKKIKKYTYRQKSFRKNNESWVEVKWQEIVPMSEEMFLEEQKKAEKGWLSNSVDIDKFLAGEEV